MRIILSRKGFDDKYGGHPSVIWPSSRKMLSFPIPVSPPERGLKATEMEFNGKKLSEIFVDLGIAKFPQEQEFHYDPQIQKLTGNLSSGLFGQSSIALNHLQSKQIRKGDIFLFFGTFCETQFLGTKVCYESMHGFHAMWGYLRVEKKIDMNRGMSQGDLKLVRSHPHYINRFRYNLDNSIIVGSDFGTFRFSDILRLTKTGYRKSFWSLPTEFHGLPITYHKVEDQRLLDDRCEFKSASIGQEFIIDDCQGVLDSWIEKVLECKDS
jgi:hypothetical protein